MCDCVCVRTVTFEVMDKSIRGFTTMRYINLRFTYLLTFTLLTYSGLYFDSQCTLAEVDIGHNATVNVFVQRCQAIVFKPLEMNTQYYYFCR